MQKQNIIQGALSLNGDDKNYVITINQDCIITTVKWFDAIHFSPSAITDEVKSFKFIVRVNDDGTWSELDTYNSKGNRTGLGGTSYVRKHFKGEYKYISKTIVFGKDRNNGKKGIVKISFNSEDYKRPVREYLTRYGYTKAKKKFLDRLFGRM